MPPAVQMRRISKRFGRVLACDQVDLTVEAGTVHALVGENGAGKSTLMNLLYGLQAADAGEIQVAGAPLGRHTPAQAIARGIGMVHQHFMLVPTLSVADNVVLGAEPRTGRLFYGRDRALRDVAALAAQFGLEASADARVGDLSVGQQQRVEILKVLYRGAQVLILDEPTAVLTPPEARALLATLREMAASGRTIVLITHKLREVMAVSDRLTVMRAGRVTGHLETAQATAAEIARLMIGRDVLMSVERPAATPGAVRVAVRALRVADDRGAVRVRDVSLEVRAGEVLGLAGVEGNGQRELVEALAGLRRVQAGQVTVDGTDVTHASVAARHAAGMAYIPEDRHRRGLVLDYTVAQNLVLGRHRAARFSGLTLRSGAIRREAVRCIDEADIRPPDPDAVVGGLSGGNQQKVVVIRELSRGPRWLIASQPTRGIDIGAVEMVHRRLLEARDAGVAVLLVSAELDEILALSDRVAVIFEGRIVATIAAGDARAESIGLLMSGGGSA